MFNLGADCLQELFKERWAALSKGFAMPSNDITDSEEDDDASIQGCIPEGSEGISLLSPPNTAIT